VMGERVADIVDEGTRLVREAETRGVALRLLGGVAVHLRCPEAVRRPELSRTYGDIDFAAPRRASRTVRDMLSEQGYVPDSHFNALRGTSRLLFYDEEHSRQIDVFLGTFEMCHKIDLEPRVTMAGPALTPSDLLLLKLQIVELNEKDILDSLALLVQYEPVELDSPATLSTTYIAQHCANDWGWHTTVRDNLQTVRDRASQILTAPEDIGRARAGAEALVATIDGAPKSLGWRLRDKIGRRKLWYDLPEEVNRV
jgi:hypothetical protein